MLIQGQVGPSSAQSVSAGATPVVRLGQQGDLIQSELHGRYYETTYRKSHYVGTVAAVTTSAGTSTTFTGMVLYNPPTSTVNLVLNKVGLAFAVAFGTSPTNIGLMVGQTYTPISTFATTSTSTRGLFLGQPQGQGVVYSSATLITTPVLQTILAVGSTAALTGFSVVPPTFYDLEGSIILPPGGYAATYTSAASGSSALYASINWEEIPV